MNSSVNPKGVLREGRDEMDKGKVDVQWTRTRFALVHNIGKIHTFGAIH